MKPKTCKATNENIVKRLNELKIPGPDCPYYNDTIKPAVDHFLFNGWILIVIDYPKAHWMNSLHPDAKFIWPKDSES